MDFGPGTYGLGYLAGVLTLLSPCVLPLVPIVVATALAAHRLGPYALALWPDNLVCSGRHFRCRARRFARP